MVDDVHTVGQGLAVTFDATNNNTLSIWTTPGSNDSSGPPTANFTTTFSYLSVGPSQQMMFFIGAGDNNDPQNLRTKANGPGAPLLPFQGQIQSVALYSSALDPLKIQEHFDSGAGTF